MKLRRRAWQGREVPLEPERWDAVRRPSGSRPQRSAEQRRAAARAAVPAIERELTPHQREVLVALTLNDVPIDVLAERLNTTRGALYKTLHDARQEAARDTSTDTNGMA